MCRGHGEMKDCFPDPCRGCEVCVQQICDDIARDICKMRGIGLLRCLTLEAMGPCRIEMRGVTSTYYDKQVAQEVAMRHTRDGVHLGMDVTVTHHQR